MTNTIFRLSPAHVFLSAVLLGCVMAGLSLLVALSQPQIDMPKGAVPLQLGDITLIDTDLIEEPDQLGSNAAILVFRDRQSLLRAELNNSEVFVAYQLPDGSRDEGIFEVRQRTLGDLPWQYWFQIVVGLISISIGGWVIGLRRDDWGARMFALTALFVPVFAHSAAIYSTRQIAIDGDVLFHLAGINGLGAAAFGIALVGLFSQYPKPMFRPVWLLIPLVLYGITIFVSYLTVGPDDLLGIVVLSQMLIALIFGAIQWYRSRHEPLNRAGLRWFILVSLLGCSLFIGLIAVPTTLGLSEEGIVSQGIAFSFFNIMHLGLALGLTRFQVFNLDRWSYYIWLWLSGMALIFALDVLLIRFMQGQPWLSLGAALLIAGFLYFPLRQLLLKLLLQRRSATLNGRMADIVSAALSPTSREHAARWDKLLSDVFKPLAPPEVAEDPVTAPSLRESGLALVVPGVDGLEPRMLRYALNGRRLFSRDDLEVAQNMVQMHKLAADSRRAYERGAILERDRISRDVHDNIGAQLLSALHSSEVSRKDDLVRDSLNDLRAIINDGFKAEYALFAILADLRTETAQRLEAHGMQLHWVSPVPPVDDAGPVISFELVNGLRSILREAVSNAIRHSQAKQMWVDVRLEEEQISLVIDDDGVGLPDDVRSSSGNGIPNIMDRAQVLMGHSELGTPPEIDAGTRISVSLPLYPDQQREKAGE